MKIRYSFIALFAFFVVACSLKAASPETFGFALAVKGEVYLVRGIIEFDVKVEETFFYEDEIETGEDGSIQISFGSSFMSVGPNTLMTFEKEVVDKKEITRIVLEEGRFRSKILGLSRREVFEVQTDAGVVTVLGTDLVTSYSSDDEDFSVGVLSGTVSLEATTEDENSSESEASEEVQSNQSTLIGANQSSSVGGDNAGLNEVNNISVAEVDAIKEELPIPGETANGEDLLAEFNPVDEVIDAIASVGINTGTGADDPASLIEASIGSPAAELILEQTFGGFTIDFQIDVGE